MVMRVQLQAARLWDVIKYGADDDQDDRAALAALLRAVPPEMVRTLAAKDCAKTAWETIKTMRLGSDRVREAKAQTRRREWEDLRFKSGESIEDFAMRLTAIMGDLELLGDPVDEYKAVLKFLRVAPKKFRPMVMAIEQTVDLRELTIEDLTGRLITAEEGYDLDDVVDSVGTKLLLTEEEWMARLQQRGPSSSSGSKGNHKQKPRAATRRRAAAVRPPAVPHRGARETAVIVAKLDTGPRSAARLSVTARGKARWRTSPRSRSMHRRSYSHRSRAPTMLPKRRHDQASPWWSRRTRRPFT
jgi:broad specificity phosphatase PhoE